MCCHVTITLWVYNGITIPRLSNPILRTFATETYMCVHQKPWIRLAIAAPLVIAQTRNKPKCLLAVDKHFMQYLYKEHQQ